MLILKLSAMHLSVAAFHGMHWQLSRADYVTIVATEVHFCNTIH